jgi:hypothetical protein
MDQELAARVLHSPAKVDHFLDVPALRSDVPRIVEELQTDSISTELKARGHGIARGADRDHVADRKTRDFRHQQPLGLRPGGDNDTRVQDFGFHMRGVCVPDIET